MNCFGSIGLAQPTLIGALVLRFRTHRGIATLCSVLLVVASAVASGADRPAIESSTSNIRIIDGSEALEAVALEHCDSDCSAALGMLGGAYLRISRKQPRPVIEIAVSMPVVRESEYSQWATFIRDGAPFSWDMEFAKALSLDDGCSGQCLFDVELNGIGVELLMHVDTLGRPTLAWSDRVTQSVGWSVAVDLSEQKSGAATKYFPRSSHTEQDEPEIICEEFGDGYKFVVIEAVDSECFNLTDEDGIGWTLISRLNRKFTYRCTKVSGLPALEDVSSSIANLPLAEQNCSCSYDD